MTIKDIANLAASAGLPWGYDHFAEGEEPELPYLLYYYPSENDFYADGENYANIREVTFELYTRTKDAASERAFEDILRSADLSWYKQTDYLSDERICQTTYETEVIINAE